jgi:pimeloyl-ACP methyl ester carboxylesterase
MLRRLTTVPVARHLLVATGTIAVALAGRAGWAAASPPDSLLARDAETVRYRAVRVEGINVFYREAGDPASPTIVLLGGFPSSSHMFRDLMPRLAGRFHLIAPDYPGFGNTDLPDPATFEYSFDHLAAITEQLLVRLQATDFGLYMQDYGSPIGNRIIAHHPEWLRWQIIQNGNSYEDGLTGAWDALRNGLWQSRTPETEAALQPFLEPEGVRQLYLTGVTDPARISPDAWASDLYFLARPGARRAQLDLLYDYRKNPPLYPAWQRFLRQHRPPTLIVWGKGDPIFGPAGALAYLRDLPDAELHLLDGGHFLLEDHAAEVGSLIVRFYDTRLAPK